MLIEGFSSGTAQARLLVSQRPRFAVPQTSLSATAIHFSDDWLHKMPWTMQGHRRGLILPGNSENGNYPPISVSNTVHSHNDQFWTDFSHKGLR